MKRQKTSWKLLDRVRNLSGLKIRILQSAENFPDDEIFYCPALDKNTGCILGDEKPFDCKIWPYRVMNFKGSKVITVCPVCGEIFSRPLRELVDFLECGLAVKIDEYSNEHPDIVKDYDFSYPILKVLGEIKQK